MEKQLATKIDSRVKDAVEAICQRTGQKLKAFVEEALIDKLEEIRDTKDIKKLKEEPLVSFDDVVKDLKKHGKL